MVFKKIIFQNRYVELETPPPSWKKNILNFHFDYLNTRLSLSQLSVRLKRLLTEAYATWVYSVTYIKSPLNQLKEKSNVELT